MNTEVTMLVGYVLFLESDVEGIDACLLQEVDTADNPHDARTRHH
jgi:hypothetical protein